MLDQAKRAFFLAVLWHLAAFGNGFKKDPWVEQFLQFRFEPSFLYRRYPHVNGGFNPASYASNDRFTQLEMGGVVFPDVDLELLIEFADTAKQRLGTQSVGGQIAYQLLDDYRGAAFSYTPCVNIRFVSSRSLQDVSCIYHYTWNFEIGQSLGKEWTFNKAWILKPYVFLGVGQANQGSPWVRVYCNFEGSYEQKHHLALICEGYFGFGKNHFVDIDQFYGYGKVYHQNIDLGLMYKFWINQIYGGVSFKYAYRVFAKNFPAHANAFELLYTLPFSFF